MGRGMAMAMVVVVAAMSAVGMVSEGKMYKVGDSVGWTIIGSPNYTAWSASKTFHVGDTILFEYSNKFHNVMEVNRSEYRTCNPSSPRKTYTTGNDSITIKRKGHYYFICGIPGHCSLGQKINIRIPKKSSSSSPSWSSSPPSNASGSRTVSTPASDSHCYKGSVGWALGLLAMSLFYSVVCV